MANVNNRARAFITWAENESESLEPAPRDISKPNQSTADVQVV